MPSTDFFLQSLRERRVLVYLVMGTIKVPNELMNIQWLCRTELF
jgi:hypothetical protein